MAFLFKGKPATNLDRRIEFMVDGEKLCRRLVMTANTKASDEISIASPVGTRLANAKVGQQFIIPSVAPDPDVVLSVLSIAPG